MLKLITGITVFSLLSGCSTVSNLYYRGSYMIHDIHMESTEGEDRDLFVKFANPYRYSLDDIILGIEPGNSNREIIEEDKNGKGQAWLHLSGPYFSGYHTGSLFGHLGEFEDVWEDDKIECVLINQIETKEENGEWTILKGDSIDSLIPQRWFCS